MIYTITAWNERGAKVAELGQRGNMAAARQAILDHCHRDDMPEESPWKAFELGIVEGWFIGSTEYIIKQRRDAA